MKDLNEAVNDLFAINDDGTDDRLIASTYKYSYQTIIVAYASAFFSMDANIKFGLAGKAVEGVQTYANISVDKNFYFGAYHCLHLIAFI